MLRFVALFSIINSAIKAHATYETVMAVETLAAHVDG